MFATRFAVVALATAASAAKCPKDLAVVQNINAPAYMGTWYQQIQTLNLPYAGNDVVCTEAQYEDLQSNGTFKVLNSDQDTLSSPRTYANLTGHCPDGNGNCWVGPVIGNPNYQIVDTDYDSYSIIFSCSVISEQILYILTRDPVISTSQLNSLLAIAK
mmetsp:Transcript_37221/g.50499  ORF Transcript_37221/g.50499 Transcript_37221/m.50499 type:complete len:159 (-) Transcript_37221:183-659(-)